MLTPWRTLFRNRQDAGQQLAARLARARFTAPVVFALPRGGVPLAAEVADRLGAPLDIVLVRKLGAPRQPELAIGAVVDGAHPQTVLNDELVARLEVPQAFIDAETTRELTVIEARRRQWLADRPRAPIKDRVAIVIDDGIATGATMRAALIAIRRQSPRRLVAAAPVGPREALRELVPPADEVVLLETPTPFESVGRYYQDFTQVDDGEVARILASHRYGAPEG